LIGLAAAQCHIRCDTSSPRAAKSHFAKAQIKAAPTPPLLFRSQPHPILLPIPGRKRSLSHAQPFRFRFVFSLISFHERNNNLFLDFVGASDVGGRAYLSIRLRLLISAWSAMPPLTRREISPFHGMYQAYRRRKGMWFSDGRSFHRSQGSLMFCTSFVFQKNEYCHDFSRLT
jgi:hypothetical protein